MVALQNYRHAIVNADLRILICKKELLDVKARLYANPHDAHLIAIHEATQARLEAHLRDCYFMKKLFAEVELDIQARISLFGEDYLKVFLELKLSFSLLERGIFKTVLDLKLHIKLNLDELIHKLTCVLLGSRHSILNLEIKLVENVGGLLGFLFRFDDRRHPGESYDDMEGFHKKLLRSAVASCAQNPYVDVVKTPYGYKRSAEEESESSSCEYKVTITDGPTDTKTTDTKTTDTKTTATNTKTVARATEETGMSATTTTSSSSSLVASFFLLFVSVLCFFLNNK